MQLSVLQWKNVGPKTCFLDDIMKMEKKKIGPQKYAGHSQWSDVLSNHNIQGMASKGKLHQHDRVLIT